MPGNTVQSNAPATHRRTSTPATKLSHSSDEDNVQATMHNAAAARTPRRKLLAAPRSPLITTETIHALANRPLAKAADSIGISESALKRICRELGFKKWPRQSVD
eukprot:1451085-Rhodomonas_salina.1